MNDACTIVCGRDDRGEALKCLYAHAPGLPAVTGPKEAWTKVELALPKSRLTLNALVRVRPMDEFSRLVLSMGTYFRDIDTAFAPMRDEVAQRIRTAKLMIGVVAEPEFSEADGHTQCVFAIAQELDGMVFTGDRMLDGFGRLLLSKAGESEVGGDGAAEIEEFLDE